MPAMLLRCSGTRRILWIAAVALGITAGTTFLESAIADVKQPKPTWELGKNPIDPAMTKGRIELVDGILKLDGKNSFSVPASVLGAQNDYTIEFECKRAPSGPTTKNAERILLVSNTDEKNQAGLGFNYFRPEYNCGWLLVNGYRTVEQRGFLDDKFNKVTIVAKDKRLMLFRNGLLLAVTAEVKPSSLPLAFGEVRETPVAPYELRNIKIYDTALFPTGFDRSAERMQYYSGDGYAMQRVTIKDSTLPRVLIVGDSISMGYRGAIAKHFQGKAYIDYWTQGYLSVEGRNSQGERALSGVLSNGPYDVVTFNFGLHWWPHPQRSPEDKYVAQMTKLVEHLKKTAPATKFVWIRTTPWRTTPAEGKPSLDNEQNQRIIRFNKMTDEIMATHGIPEVDLYGLCEKKLDTVAAGSKDAVHWNQEVSRLMAEEIVKEIEKCLATKHR